MSEANVLPDNLQAEFDNLQQIIAAYEQKNSELHQALNGTNEENTTLRHALSGKEETIHNLKSELSWARRQLFGPKRESLPKEQPKNQLGLFGKQSSDDDIAVDGVEDADIQLAETSQGTKAGDDIPKSPPSIDPSSDASKKHTGRRPISSNIETQEIVIPVAEEDKIDEFGERLVSLGFSIYEQVIRIPGKLMKITYKRERYGYKDTREVCVTADHKPSIIPRGKYGDEFLHETVVQKFYNGMPLYRQLQELHALGAEDIGKSVMSDTIKNFAKFYAPVCEAIRQSIVKSAFVHLDESPLIQLLRDGKLLGYLWAIKDAHQVFYAYASRRSGDVAENLFFPPDDKKIEEYEKYKAEMKLDPHLKTDAKLLNKKRSKDRMLPKDLPDPGNDIFVRYIMTDGYAPYEKVAELIKAVRMNCWAHARRKFFVASSSNDVAKLIVRIIDRLYLIERRVHEKAQREKWSYTKLVAERFKARRSKSAKFIKILEKKLHEIQIYATPKSALGKACSYCIRNLEAQKVYLTDGRLPIDNNTVERSIRPIAVGRKNFMFVGSERAGEWAAICYTIMENCRMNKLDPRKYLDYVTKQIHAQGRDMAEYDLLTPLAAAEDLKNSAL